MRVRCTPVSGATPSVSPFVMLACCPTKKLTATPPVSAVSLSLCRAFCLSNAAIAGQNVIGP